MSQISNIGFLFFLLTLQSYSQVACPLLKTDQLWFASMELDDTVSLDFHFRIMKGDHEPQMEIYNGDEILQVDELIETGDSLGFKMPVFDSELRFKYINRDSISGYWINYARATKNRLHFSASQYTISPSPNSLPVPMANSFVGKWEVDFNPGNKNEAYKAIGLFDDPACWDRIYGTFLTETGDYRYLSGTIFAEGKDTLMKLSSFDGAHAYVFIAKVKADKTLEGDFYSGAHGHEKWTGKRNKSFELRSADSLTFLKPGFDKLEFRFPGLDGKMVFLSDEKYKGKVVIVQIMGSWCPNCMDETKFLSLFYKQNAVRGLEVVALAYERTGDVQRAVANIQRLKKRFDSSYDFLLASTSSDKESAAKTLPALQQLLSFPTTIYIDRKGKVRKISTGFSGPATGEYYEKFVEETNRFVDGLLKE